MPALKSTRQAYRRQLHPLVGQLGEFTDGRGRVTQCRVTSVNEEEHWLRVTYFNREAGRTIKGAYIGTLDFLPDKLPNS